ncbi:MAG: TPR repeat protein [Myxococcota bacterium]
MRLLTALVLIGTSTETWAAPIPPAPFGSGLTRPAPQACQVPTGPATGLSVSQITDSVRGFLWHTNRCVEGLEEIPEGALDVELRVGCDGLVDDSQPVNTSSAPGHVVDCVVNTLYYAPFPAHDVATGVGFVLPIAFARPTSPAPPPPMAAPPVSAPVAPAHTSPLAPMPAMLANDELQAVVHAARRVGDKPPDAAPQAPVAPARTHGVVVKGQLHEGTRVVRPADTVLTPPPRGAAPARSPQRDPDALAGLDEVAIRTKCDEGDALACYEVGTFSTDPREAVAALELACEAWMLPACTAAASLVLAGHSDTPIGCGSGSLEKACEGAAHGPSCAAWLPVSLLAEGSLCYAPGRGRKLAVAACSGPESDPDVCLLAGGLLAAGVGSDRDRSEAVVRYQRACASDLAEACRVAGALSLAGEGVKQDVEGGVASLRRACELGDAPGCVAAGRALEEGTWVERDVAESLRLYATGCEREAVLGCLGAGRMNEALGGERSVDARVAYERAITLGSVEAKRRLARLLWEGIGGPKVRARAKQLCIEACSAGDRGSCSGARYL